MINPGEKRFVALVNEISRVTIVQPGTGIHTFPRGKTPKKPYVVRADRNAECGLAAGDEFCVEERLLFTNPVDAHVESKRIARYLDANEGGDDDDDEDESEEGEEGDDEGEEEDDDYEDDEDDEDLDEDCHRRSGGGGSPRR